MRLALILSITALLGSGCGVELLTTTAITSNLQKEQMGAAKRQLDQAANTSTKTNAQQAIRLYQAEKGQYPPSLEALVPSYLAELPRKADGTPYGYDPATGSLLDGPVQGAIPQADMQTMNAIRNAINSYGTATGFYPGTLDVLTPTYLATPPRTVDGRAFLYNNQTGEVRHPGTSAGQAAAPSVNRGAVGGAGPLGETMTGIGIQQQLQNSSQGGANAAGNRSRSQSRDISSDHSDRQLRAIENLGL